MRRSRMTCREFVGLIPAYLDAELGRTDAGRFDQHARDCRRCSDYLKGYELTVNAARRSKDLGDENRTKLPQPLVRWILNAAPRPRSRA